MSEPPAVPVHVGIIPDGNRRWARRNRVPLLRAYMRGYENVKAISRHLYSRGARVVTVYGLSRENCLMRSPEEKQIIEEVAVYALRDLREDPFLSENGIRVRVLGRPRLFSERLESEAQRTVRARDKGEGGLLVILICYSGRAEALEYAARGMVPPSLLLPPVDLVIRTGGARRLSGFIPTAADYAELYFTDKLWPDFTRDDVDHALEWFSSQQRNFGK